MKPTVALALGRSELPACMATGRKARELLDSCHVEHIIFCGDQSWLLKKKAEQPEALTLLRGAWPLALDLFSLETKSTATVTNMTEAKKLFYGKTWRRIVIVCIPYAGPRARLTAQKVFGAKYDISVVPSNYHFPFGNKERAYVIITEVAMLIITWLAMLGVPAGHSERVLRRWELTQAWLRKVARIVKRA